MRTRATRRPSNARRSVRRIGVRRVSRAMREPWWGPAPEWRPIICRRASARRRPPRMRIRFGR